MFGEQVLIIASLFLSYTVWRIQYDAGVQGSFALVVFCVAVAFYCTGAMVLNVWLFRGAEETMKEAAAKRVTILYALLSGLIALVILVLLMIVLFLPIAKLFGL
jgi:hypothetical protein